MNVKSGDFAAAPRISTIFRIYDFFGISFYGAPRLPCKISYLPNWFIFVVTNYLLIQFAIFKAPRSCVGGRQWKHCLLDSAEGFPLVGLFYLKMYYKSRSNHCDFEEIFNYLPLTKTSVLEAVLMCLCFANNAIHWLSLIRLHDPQLNIYISLYILTALLAFFVILQFIGLVRSLNSEFCDLVENTRKYGVSRWTLSKKWTLVRIAELIDGIYGPTLTILVLWTGGKLVNNIYTAMLNADGKNWFLCFSAAFKFGLIFFVMHVCEQTKGLVSTQLSRPRLNL